VISAPQPAHLRHLGLLKPNVADVKGAFFPSHAVCRPEAAAAAGSRAQSALVGVQTIYFISQKQNSSSLNQEHILFYVYSRFFCIRYMKQPVTLINKYSSTLCTNVFLVTIERNLTLYVVIHWPIMLLSFFYSRVCRLQLNAFLTYLSSLLSLFLAACLFCKSLTMRAKTCRFFGGRDTNYTLYFTQFAAFRPKEKGIK